MSPCARECFTPVLFALVNVLGEGFDGCGAHAGPSLGDGSFEVAV
jgi:hypothetical protein